MTIRILGIDPGFANVGLFGVTVGLGLKAEMARLILTEKCDGVGQYPDDERRLCEIENAFEAVLAEFKPDIVVSERTASLRMAKVTRQLALAYAGMHSRATVRGLRVLIFDPEEIKFALCKSRRADKAQMAKKLIGLFPAFHDWPKLGNRKRKMKNAKVTSSDAIAHVVDAAGACVASVGHPVVQALLRERANAVQV